MSLSVLLAFLWVVASAIVAMLPMRHQYAPGLPLLLVAPVLIIWIGYDHGWGFSVVGLLAFGSMFRHPLRYLTRKALGLSVSRPEERPE